MDVTPEVPRIEIPEFVRKAIIAQGKCDPDEIAEKAALLDLDAPSQEEIRQEPLVQVPREGQWWEK